MPKKDGLGKTNRIYEIYKNTLMPHGRDIYNKSSDMEKSTMCACPQSDHALPHWKYVFSMFCEMTKHKYS